MYILQIANIKKKITIYFPVKLDQTGRIYCINCYFYYKANDLAKSLLLFNKSDIIQRNDK